MAITQSERPPVAALREFAPCRIFASLRGAFDGWLAAANARIGIAKAAFFPVLRLTGSGGYLSGDVESLFNWDSRVWAIGPSISLPIFAGGRNRANHARSKFAYEESLARYRQQVLVAFADVENTLSAISALRRQSSAQERAVTFARRAAELPMHPMT